MLKRIKYKKGAVKEYCGIKYRVFQHSPTSWFWETRKWLIWEHYPHACYDNAEDADRYARSCIKACAEGTARF